MIQSETNSIRVVRELTGRLLPDHWEQIHYEEITDHMNQDVYEIDTISENILIRGNNAISMAVGLGHYLKYTAKCNISWCGSS